MVRPGRRQALAGLLMGAATLVSGSRRTTTAKKKKPRCPKCPKCPEPTVCPPLPDPCPIKTCCQCNAQAQTPGCHRTDGFLTEGLCSDVCGGPATWTFGFGPSAPGTFSGVCTDAGQCVSVPCPVV
jgi:hypothetical protein